MSDMYRQNRKDAPCSRARFMEIAQKEQQVAKRRNKEEESPEYADMDLKHVCVQDSFLASIEPKQTSA